jgi:ankyrin repeat protein
MAGLTAHHEQIRAACLANDAGSYDRLNQLLAISSETLDLKDRDNNTILYYLLNRIFDRKLVNDKIRLLVEHGASVNFNCTHNGYSYPLFHLLVMHCAYLDDTLTPEEQYNESLIKLFLTLPPKPDYSTARAVNVNVTNYAGNTALYYTWLQHTFTFLIKSGINVNSQNNDDNTLLHVLLGNLLPNYIRRRTEANYAEYEEIIIQLLENGANLTIRNLQRQTPVDVMQHPRPVIVFCANEILNMLHRIETTKNIKKLVDVIQKYLPVIRIAMERADVVDRMRKPDCDRYVKRMNRRLRRFVNDEYSKIMEAKSTFSKFTPLLSQTGVLTLPPEVLADLNLVYTFLHGTDLPDVVTADLVSTLLTDDTLEYIKNLNTIKQLIPESPKMGPDDAAGTPLPAAPLAAPPAPVAARRPDPLTPADASAGPLMGGKSKRKRPKRKTRKR